LQHWQETGHPVGVKLGTITPEGTGGGYETRVVCRIADVADIYCYACDDAKVDPELANHLHTFGIEVMGQTKTEKSMTELVSAILRTTSVDSTDRVQQLEHNLKFDFSMTGDDGRELEPVFGRGLTGFKNLGNR
jgi:ubiquitin carboxyl-terminal hydrolase 5/13